MVWPLGPDSKSQCHARMQTDQRYNIHAGAIRKRSVNGTTLHAYGEGDANGRAGPNGSRPETLTTTINIIVQR